MLKLITNILILLLLGNLSFSAFSQERQVNVSFTQPPKFLGDAGEDKVIFTEVPITMGTDIEVEGGEPEYQYKWLTPMGDSILTPSFVIINSPGTYYLTITDTRNCVLYDSVIVSLATQSESVATEKPLIFPNPADEFLYYKVVTGSSPADLSIMTTAGNIVLSTILPASAYRAAGSIDLRNIPPGPYILRIRTASSGFTQMLIIKR